ncbi:hypothetical protein M3194_17375 [Paenibacillus glycanilyticus]|uniref:hypothetical protein n=1 Tax=Paenibacillus glycanilyticus TaxID=126569 RepID=UPI00203B3517|nr:hypothetical protein [Paenibacillus glycanilyticus]MCM3629117.1 hypothetical protein [Paenibacillus glycanilyticus]
MEEEVIFLLKWGFVSVMCAVLVIVIGLIAKYKKSGYIWILAHLILFSWGALRWIKVLETRATSSSIDNSLTIAWIGVIWTISMICMSVGLLLLSPQKKHE